MRKLIWLPILLAAVSLLPAQKSRSQEFDLSGDKQWLDTGMDVHPSDSLRVSATGSMQYPQSKTNGPEGLPRGWKDLLRILPLNDAGRGALLGRIGSDAAAQPFLIGPARENRVAAQGRLFLGINQLANDRTEGSYHVQIEIAAGVLPATVDESRLPRMTQELLDRLPIRVSDAAGDPGDRVNFLILGNESKMQRSLQEAGWVVVNRTKKDAVLEGLLTTLSRQSYVQMPMSELQLFGRPQDYGYAHADPLTVVATRHHFRLWKAPFTVSGETLWVGAGTHDTGFDKDQRNGKLTHKIDPETDLEREFIGQSLKDTGEVAKLSYMTPAHPLTKAKTAHGEEFNSDGRVLSIVLNPDARDKSAVFGDLFCSVLAIENPDGGDWGDCAQYITSASGNRVALGPISNQYRLLLVPGLMNTCFSSAPAYKEGQAYLRQKYGLTVELLALPNDSCEDNARKIADYLRDKMKTDTRKYIVLGYSKGVPDLQVALAREPGVAAAVAAFIAVAGASGGSPIADSIPSMADRWISQYSLPSCQGDLSQGYKSLSQNVRRAFLARYPDPIVPTYSIPAVSDRTHTSKIFLNMWMLLSAFADRQDSQLVRQDAIVPGSSYLGDALADHFAVALPYESSNESIRPFADKNHYPRTALLEAMVRLVIQDLNGTL